MSDQNLNVYLLTGPTGVGKSYLAEKLVNATNGAQLDDLLANSEFHIEPDTTTLVVDHAFNDEDVEKAIRLSIVGQVDTLVIIGQDKRDFKREFNNHLHLHGKPGERVFTVSRNGSHFDISEGQIITVSQLVH